MKESKTGSILSKPNALFIRLHRQLNIIINRLPSTGYDGPDTVLTIDAWRTMVMIIKPFRSDVLWAGFGPIVLMATMLQAACSLDHQLLYDRGGLQVGLQHDPTTDVIGVGEMGSGPASPRNDHPYAFDQSELRQLLGSLVIATPNMDGQRSGQREVPLYRPDELNKLVPVLTAAFGRASRMDRVFFSLASSPLSPNGGRTTGTLFVRHRSLHVTLNPFVLPNEGKILPIDGRPITLQAAKPVEEVFVKGPGAPLWFKSETIHISLKIPETVSPEYSVLQSAEAAEVSDQSERLAGTSAQENVMTVREHSDRALRRQVEELTATLKELHTRVTDQASELESVKAEVKRLQDQIAQRAHLRVSIQSPLEQ